MACRKSIPSTPLVYISVIQIRGKIVNSFNGSYVKPFSYIGQITPNTSAAMLIYSQICLLRNERLPLPECIEYMTFEFNSL